MKAEKHREKRHILIRVIIEIVGAPKEHIKKALKEYVEFIKENRNYDIISEDYAEPEKDDKNDKLYSTYAELELWVPSIDEVYFFCFDSLPSSIEVLEPEGLEISNVQLTNSANDLVQKLHKLDMSMKESNARISLLEENTKVLAANLVAVSLREKPLFIDDIIKITGIPKEKLENFLTFLVNEKRIKQEKDGKYSLFKNYNSKK
jgi:hypothetical protein